MAMKGSRMNVCRWYFVHWLIWDFQTVLCDRRQCPILFMCPSFCMQIKDGCYVCDCGSVSGYLQKASNELSRLSAQHLVQTGTQMGSSTFGSQTANMHSGKSGIDSHHENGPGMLQTFSYQPLYNSGYGRLFAHFDGMVQSGQRPDYHQYHPLYSSSETDRHHLFMPGMGCGYVRPDCPSVCWQTDIYTGCITCSCASDQKSTTLKKAVSTQPSIATTTEPTRPTDASSTPQVPIYDTALRTPSTPHPHVTSKVIPSLIRPSTRYPHVTAKAKPTFKTTPDPIVATKVIPPLKVPSTPHPHITSDLTLPVNARATPSHVMSTKMLPFHLQSESYLHTIAKVMPPLKEPTPRKTPHLTTSQAVTFSVSSIQRNIRTPTTPTVSAEPFTENVASNLSGLFKGIPSPSLAFKLHLLQTTSQPMLQTSQISDVGLKQINDTNETRNVTQQVLRQYNKQENAQLRNRSYAQMTTESVTIDSLIISSIVKEGSVNVQLLSNKSELFEGLPSLTGADYKNLTNTQLQNHSNINAVSSSMDSALSIHETAVSGVQVQLPGISEVSHITDQTENTKKNQEHVIGLFGNVKSGTNDVSGVWDPNSASLGSIGFPDRHTDSSNNLFPPYEFRNT